MTKDPLFLKEKKFFLHLEDVEIFLKSYMSTVIKNAIKKWQKLIS